MADDLNAHTQTGVRLHIAQTQGSIPDGDPDYWLNEIHPRNTGYERLIRKFQDVIEPIRDALPPAPWRAWPG